MLDGVKLWITELFGARLGVFLCSVLPIVELRGAIPLGALLSLPWWQSLLLAVLGNMLPVPFILLFIRRVIAWMAHARHRTLQRLGTFLVKRAEKNREQVEKYAFFGLSLFVGIPLPVTGAWTGALVAAMMNMKFYKAFFACLLGVLISGVLVTLLTYGTAAVLAFLF